MSTQMQVQENSVSANLESVLMRGDLKALSSSEKVSYYKKVCDSLGLNFLTKPFEYITLNNKEVLYATRACTEQLRLIHGVSLQIVKREQIGDVYIVTANAKNKEGRIDESTGCVAVKGLSGDALANAFMKCETKAKRRVTLSICGLGFLDETEVETIREVVVEPARQIPNPLKDTKEEQPENYEITFGKWKSLTLGQVAEQEGSEKIQSYCQYIRDKAASDNKPIQGMVLEFLEFASIFLDSKRPENVAPAFDQDEEFPF